MHELDATTLRAAREIQRLKPELAWGECIEAAFKSRRDRRAAAGAAAMIATRQRIEQLAQQRG